MGIRILGDLFLGFSSEIFRIFVFICLITCWEGWGFELSLLFLRRVCFGDLQKMCMKDGKWVSKSFILENQSNQEGIKSANHLFSINYWETS